MKTFVIYTRNGTKYQHVFPTYLSREAAETKMIMERKVGRSEIKSIFWQ